MTTEELTKIFEEEDNEFLNFDKIQNKRSSRADLHAFMLLDQLIPDSGEDIIVASEHDQIYLAIGLEELAKVATRDHIIELKRCGVMVDDMNEGLSMFT
jgi:hypothetical protein